MYSIKFSHRYRKLLNESGKVVDRAKLLDVIQYDISQMSEVLRKYDTDNGAYNLPNTGIYIMLLFMKPTGSKIESEKPFHLFTTIRPYKMDKFKWYKENIGKVFNVEITGADNDKSK